MLFRSALKRSSDTLTGYFKRDIDGANIMTALKLKAQGISSNLDRYFVAGGKEVSRERFAQIAAGTGGLDGLSAFSSLSETSDLGQAESVVRNVLLKDAKRLYTSDALGIFAAERFAGENDDAGVDIVGMKPRLPIRVINDRSERALVDPRLTLVRRQRHRRLIERFARIDEVSTGQILSPPPHSQPGEHGLRAR